MRHLLLITVLCCAAGEDPAAAQAYRVKAEPVELTAPFGRLTVVPFSAAVFEPNGNCLFSVENFLL